MVLTTAPALNRGGTTTEAAQVRRAATTASTVSGLTAPTDRSLTGRLRMQAQAKPNPDPDRDLEPDPDHDPNLNPNRVVILQ